MPIIHFLLHHVLGMTVALSNLAFELLAVAVYRGKVAVSELAPLFLDLTDKLLLVTFDSIPIHVTLLLRGDNFLRADGLINQRRFRPPSVRADKIPRTPASPARLVAPSLISVSVRSDP